jgi:hypothetical protein
MQRLNQAANQHLGDLTPRNRTVGWIPGKWLVALQHDEPILIGLVVVELGGAHDRVMKAARPNETLGALLPVVRTFAVSRGYSRHERDARFAPCKYGKDITHAPIIEPLPPPSDFHRFPV